ncbi:Stomatin [uncultured archaeon]|nr:Stomatin [uncultured archaeon]
MGWVQEIADVLGRLSFFDIIYEYQQGLYFRNGTAIEKRIKWGGEELEEIVAEEKKVIEDNGGKLKLIKDYYSGVDNMKLPKGWKKHRITGLPRHEKRYEKDKILRPGLYFNIPLYDAIVIHNKKQKVLNLGNISILTTDSEPKRLTVSCNIRYELMDLYRAFTEVDNYEKSLVDYGLSILAMHSRGRRYKEWADTNIVKEVEELVRDDLRNIATRDWGLKIHQVYVTDNVESDFNRVAHEGNIISDEGLVIKLAK